MDLLPAVLVTKANVDDSRCGGTRSKASAKVSGAAQPPCSRRSTPVVEPLVETRAVSKRYGTTLALDNVSMRVAAGPLGRPCRPERRRQVDHGAACSPDSTGRTAARSASRASLLRTFGARRNGARSVACVYQKSTIIPELTVGENLFLNDQPGSRLGSINWRELRRRARSELDVVGARRRHRPACGRPHRRPAAASRDRPRAAPGQPLHHPRRADRTARGARDRAALRPHHPAEGRRRHLPLHLAPSAGDLRDLRARGGDARRPAGRRGGGRRPRQGRARRRDGRRIFARAQRADRPRRPLGRAQAKPTSNGSGARPVVLDVDSVSVAGSVRGRLDPRSRRRTGRARRPCGLGQVRARPGDRRTARPRGGRISVDGRPLKPGRVDLPARSASRYVPEDRHASRLLQQPLGRGEHRAAGAPPAEPLAGFRLAPTGGASWPNSMIAQLQIKVSDPEAERRRAFRREPAEDGDGPGARLGPARARARISDGRRRHRLEAGAVRHHPGERMRQCCSSPTRPTSSLICDRVMVMFAGRVVREFTGSWKEHEMVAAMEGVGQ